VKSRDAREEFEGVWHIALAYGDLGCDPQRPFWRGRRCHRVADNLGSLHEFIRGHERAGIVPVQL